MAGKLIFVSGLTGAGKTTLVGAALKRVENLEVLLTYTTRPMRSGEEDSYEYLFVTDEEYEAVKARSSKWDETIYGSYKYASDAEKFIGDLRRGSNVIVSVTPNLDNIKQMARIYRTSPVTVWINTNAETARRRVADDPKRRARVEDERVKDAFDIIYEPAGILQDDIESFTNLIKVISSAVC